MNDQRTTCPQCGNDDWNKLGCMTCGLEFFPPSEAYQDASRTPVSQRAGQARADWAAAWVSVTPARSTQPAGRSRPREVAERESPGALPATASPIEILFWDAHRRLRLPALAGLVSQHPAGRYRIDFALPDSKIGIELDGFATHSSTAAIAKDRKRQRGLEAQGWRIIRFGGAEVHRDAEGCACQAAGLIERIRKGA